MAQEPNAVEQAVSRALRENLERIQKTSEELHQAVGDIVSACASSRPTHALPPMLRAQAAAASLTAALEVMSRFVAMALQPAARSPLEAEIARLAGSVAVAEPVEPAVAPKPPATPPQRPPQAQVPLPARPEPMVAAPVEPEIEEIELHPEPVELAEPAPAVASVEAEPELKGEFDINRLSAEEQELHRRANRVAKVSMQDIKMLHPDKVRQGRENKDLCIRLKDDIEKAHREYDRRFKPIMDHPVDYFYRWMVEILADGDAHALGEYPYAVPARQR
jgi:hypothetical protein